jgi:transcriptional regulator GlxA family with amidase domain
VNARSELSGTPVRAGGGPTVMAFLILPGFPMACLTSAIEPLRAANEIAGREAFRWIVVGETRAPVTASAGVAFAPDAALDELGRVDALYVLSSPAGTLADPRRAYARLRRLDREGVVLGAFSGGVFPLARAGLLAGYRVSVHWCYEAAFAAEFPELAAEDSVITLDRRRQTAAGANAVFELMLRRIEAEIDARTMTEVACWFQHPMVRGDDVRQRRPTIRSAATADMLPEAVARTIRLFERHIADPVPIGAAARAAGISARQLERSFKAATGMSPLVYYRMLRLREARQLVLYSNRRLAEIAAWVGYGSSTRLARHYREAFGRTPAEDRERINLFRLRGHAPVPAD